MDILFAVLFNLTIQVVSAAIGQVATPAKVPVPVVQTIAPHAEAVALPPTHAPES